MTGLAAAAPGPAVLLAADQGVGDVPGDRNADFVAAHEGKAWSFDGTLVGQLSDSAATEDQPLEGLMIC
jgi:hypothetical protein